MLKYLSLYLAAFVLLILTSCSFVDFESGTGSVTFSLARAAVSSVTEEADYTIDIELKGDYTEKASVLIADGASITFDGIEVGKAVYAEASVYKTSDSKKTPIYAGKSETITIKDGSNALALNLKNVYTVTFNTNGVSDISSQSVIDGEKAEKPEVPTKEETEKTLYVFAGWFTDEEYTKEFDFDTAITSDTTVYAKWEEKPYYTVTFNTNGGSDVGSQKVLTGEKATKPETDPTKDATDTSLFVFAGWYADEEYTKEFDFDTAITSDTTVYAKWTEKVKVTIDITVDESDINDEEISVEKDEGNSKVAFTAASGYDSYEWKVDNVVKSTSNELVLELSASAEGVVHDVVLLAKKGSEYYSYTAHVTAKSE